MPQRFAVSTHRSVKVAWNDIKYHGYFRLNGPEQTLLALGHELFEQHVSLLRFQQDPRGDPKGDALYLHTDQCQHDRVRGMASRHQVTVKLIGPYMLAGNTHQPFSLALLDYPLPKPHRTRLQSRTLPPDAAVEWYFVVDTPAGALAQRLYQEGFPVVCYQLKHTIGTYVRADVPTRRSIRNTHHALLRHAYDLPYEQPITAQVLGAETAVSDDERALASHIAAERDRQDHWLTSPWHVG